MYLLGFIKCFFFNEKFGWRDYWREKLINIEIVKKSKFILFLKNNLYFVINFSWLFVKGVIGSYMCVFVLRNVLEGFKYSECCRYVLILYIYVY